MREINFRGKTGRLNNWVYGSYQADVMSQGTHTIMYSDYLGFYVEDDVDPKTVGQYTGLKDKNGKEIYEGDIVRTWEQEEYVPDRDSGGGIVGYDKVDGFSQLGVVSYEGASFIYTTQKHLEGREEQLNAPIDWFNELVVVGNVHDNPELLQ